jgi:hypothetical protein
VDIVCRALLTICALSLGILGATAKEVEKDLATNFGLANRWGCILLLDEADVFLAGREGKDFVGNGLVSGSPVMLNLPESKY